MEGKGDSSLTQTKPDALPAHGRPLSHMQRIGLGIVGITTALSAAGCKYLPGFSTSAPTPESSRIVEPSSSPVPSISPDTTIVLPSATPVETVAPTPSATPSETPIPTPVETVANIETVPLLPGGKAQTDLIGLSAYNGTVVAIDRNPDGTVKDFAITIAGNKISRTCTDQAHCKYAGATFWLNVTNSTQLISADYLQVTGQGSAAVSKYIVLGKELPWVEAPILKSKWDTDWNADVPGNLASLQALNNSVGKSLPRANRSFVFSGIVIAQP